LRSAALVLQFALWATRLLSRWLAQRAEAARGTDPEAATTVTLLGFIGRVAIWALALLFGLDQLGFDVTALVAGLGIGGIAVALAVQTSSGICSPRRPSCSTSRSWWATSSLWARMRGRWRRSG
jgi:small-conductance mechanosensitive channel